MKLLCIDIPTNTWLELSYSMTRGQYRTENTLRGTTMPPLQSLEEALEFYGTFTVDRRASERLLEGQLVCHRCREVLENMPRLKEHLVACVSAPT